MKKLLVFSLAIILVVSTITAQEEEKLSFGEARVILLKSLIFPGWGEHTLGRHQRGYLLNLADLGLMAGYVLSRYYGRLYYNTVVAFAVSHAGIDPDGKDMQYFTDVGNYLNIYEYNEQKLRNRQIDLVYPLNEKYFWAWDSEANKKRFDKYRIRSGIFYRNASMLFAGLAVNRIVSAIDIIAITRKRLEEPELSLRPRFYHLPGVVTSISLDLKW